jgi:hypothetical protein
MQHHHLYIARHVARATNVITVDQIKHKNINNDMV